MSYDYALHVQCARWASKFLQQYKCLPTVLWVDKPGWQRLRAAADVSTPRWRPTNSPCIYYYERGRMVRIYQR